MKKLIYVAMLLIGIGIMAVSCSKAKTEDYSTTIVGKWQTYKVVDANGKTSTQGADDETMYLTCYESGQFIIEEIDSDGDTYAQKGNYWIEESTLYLNQHGYTQGLEIVKLTKKELVLGSKDGDISKMYLKRIE